MENSKKTTKIEINDKKKDREQPNKWDIYKIIIIGALIGLSIILLFSIYKGQLKCNYSTLFLWLSVSVIIGLACSGMGFFVGFLFGVPHIKAKKETDTYSYTPNTSLEQISDWLTKIIIGLGLTQLMKLPNFLHHISQEIVNGINCAPLCPQEDTTFIIFLLIFYLILGFFFGYFFSRLELQKRFVNADLFDKTEQKLQEEEGRTKELLSTASDKKESLNKILNDYQKRIIIEIIKNRKYIIPHKILSYEEFMDLKKLFKYNIVKIIENDGVFAGGNTIVLSKHYEDLKIEDVK